MAEQQKHRNSRQILPNETVLKGWIEIGAAGAVNSQAGLRDSGVTFVKNASTGRYDGTLHRGYRRAGAGYAMMAGPTAGTVPNAAKDAAITGVTAAMFAGTTGITTFSIVTTAADGATATNPTSGDIITWELPVYDSVRA